MTVNLHSFELSLPSDHFFTTPGSELSSPFGSDQLSLEEDDHIGSQMAQSWPGLSGSPESTLWSQFGSNHNCPIGPSRESLSYPPLKINEETARYNQGERFSNTSNPIQEFGGNLNTGFQSKHALIDEQIRKIQFHRIQQEQVVKQMEQNQRINHYHQKKRSAAAAAALNNNNHNPWYNNLQQQQGKFNQQAGSHTRSVFLNKSGSCGTGVFLPRGIGGTTTTESHKKQGCATVLIPARVVQALKLHFDKTGVPTRSNNSGISLQHDACCVNGRNNNTSMYSPHKGRSKTVQAMNHQEMSLPQEWTY